MTSDLGTPTRLHAVVEALPQLTSAFCLDLDRPDPIVAPRCPRPAVEPHCSAMPHLRERWTRDDALPVRHGYPALSRRWRPPLASRGGHGQAESTSTGRWIVLRLPDSQRVLSPPRHMPVPARKGVGTSAPAIALLWLGGGLPSGWVDGSFCEYSSAQVNVSFH